ncbi:MAG TPA: FG-GAP-like repeat-containing protein, partial [Ilumatobacteraceae bacterium]|nr:FG-GAP-like repeat-containing protein [Ilumatobacteraceae bacterium]
GGPMAALVLFCVLALAATSRAVTFTREVSGPIVNDGAESTGGSWEDYDGDGDPDLYVPCGNLVPQNDRLYRNDFGLFFASIGGPVASDNTPSIGGTWGDMDGDGDPDLFVSNRQGVNELLYRNDGADTFVSLTTAAPVVVGGNTNSTSWVDLDRDGALDLYVINFNERKRHWRNDGSGNFTEILVGAHVTGMTTSISGVWSDFDRDGDQDCYVANGGNVNNDLFRNDGATFVNVAASAGLQDGGQSIGASWGDWDNDGWPDLFVANTVGGNDFLYRNLGNGTFARILSGPVVTDAANSVGSAFGDMDDDGDLDLFVGVDGGNNRLYRNDGTAFVQITTGAIVTDGGATFGVSWADWNSDGYLDAFAANRSGQDDFLYTNDGGSNHWLEIRLVGTVSNRTAIGTRVEAYATIGGQSVRQSRERESQTGYNSASDPRVCFGLSDATAADSLTIAWPSGLQETIRSVAADQVLTLVEGATLTGAPAVAGTTLGELRIEPNPARQLARVRWSLPGSGPAVVSVIDLRGRVVRTLVPDAQESATWNGRDEAGRSVASGTYFVVVRRGDTARTGRVTWLR